MVNKELLARQLHLGLETFADLYSKQRLDVVYLGDTLSKFDLPVSVFWLIIKAYTEPAVGLCVGEFKVADVVYSNSSSKLRLAWSFVPNRDGILLGLLPVEMFCDVEADEAQSVFDVLLHLWEWV